MKKVLIAPNLRDPQYDSKERREGFSKLAKLATIEGYDQDTFTADDATDVMAVIADSALFTREFYEAAEDLRVVARWGVGYDKVNLEIATELGVVICVAPAHMATVAEYAITQWLATLKRVYTLNRMSHKGDFGLLQTYDAEGSTLGIYGLGRIGQQVAKRALPLLGDRGRLLVYDIRQDIHALAAEFGAEVVDDPMRLFQECDAVSLHVAGDDTIVTYEHLSAMKPHASLINPSRGNLVNDEDANRAIREDRLFYYVVDDPTNGPREVHRGHPRIICTNHNAGVTIQSVIRLEQMNIDQVMEVLGGQRPPHILNPKVLKHPRVQAWMTSP